MSAMSPLGFVGRRLVIRLVLGSALIGGVLALGAALAYFSRIPDGPTGPSMTAHLLAVPGPTILRTTVGDVRLAGIRVDACQRQEASEALASMATAADELTVAPGPGPADVWADKTYLNEAMVAKGWAHATDARFKPTEDEARRAGLYAECPR